VTGRAGWFTYVGFDIKPKLDRVTFRYRLDDREFHEEIIFPDGGDWDRHAVVEAARLLFLLTGVSYYKAGAPPVIDVGDTPVTPLERSFLLSYHLDGLGEFAHRNDLDLSDLRIVGPTLTRSAATPYTPKTGRPLIPFGGGLDSIVTVELVRPLWRTRRCSSSTGRTTASPPSSSPRPSRAYRSCGPSACWTSRSCGPANWAS
jgi:hypothetical protein